MSYTTYTAYTSYGDACIKAHWADPRPRPKPPPFPHPTCYGYLDFDTFRRYMYQRKNNLYVGHTRKSFKECLKILKTSKRTDFILRIYLNGVTEGYAHIYTEFLKELNSLKHMENIRELYIMKNYWMTRGSLFQYGIILNETVKFLNEYHMDNNRLEVLKFPFTIFQDLYEKQEFVEMFESMKGNTVLKEVTIQLKNAMHEHNIRAIEAFISESHVENVHVLSDADTNHIYDYYDLREITRCVENRIQKALSVPMECRLVPLKSKTKSAAKVS